MLLVITGAGLTGFSLVADLVGFSKPGFGVTQMRALVIGIALLISGTALFLSRKKLTDKVISDMSDAFVSQFLIPKKTDLLIAFVLFCLATIVGTLYVANARSIGGSLFYAPTVLQPDILSKHVYIYGLMFGATLVLCYSIFRLGIGRFMSTICAIGLLSSPIHLYILVPSLLRDYIRAPFVLAIVFILGLLVVPQSLRRHRVLVLSLVAGVIIGIGLWFRSELAIMAPLVILTLIFFQPGPIFSDLRIKSTACILFLGAVLFFTLPASRAESTYSFHVTTGLGSYFDARLGVDGSKYDWGHQASDEFLAANIYAQVKQGKTPVIKRDDINYGSDVGFVFFKKILLNFPADMLTRTYGSILKILELPFAYIEPPVGVTNNAIIAFYALRASILNVLSGLGVLLVAAALLFISLAGLRKAVFALVLTIYLAGYPVLQFFGRHYFYLEFISWWALGFVVQSIFVVAYSVAKSRSTNGLAGKLFSSDFKYGWTTAARRVLIFAVLLPGLLLIPLAVLRQYQSKQVVALLRSYSKAGMQKIPVVKVKSGKSNILLTNKSQFKRRSGQLISVDYLVAEFKDKPGDSSTIWPTIFYENPNRGVFSARSFEAYGRPTFSQTVRVDFGNSHKVRLFFPAMFLNSTALWSSMYFKGLEIPAEQLQNFRGLYRIKKPERFPIMLTAIVPPVRGYTGLYKTLTSWETSNISTVPANVSPTVIQGLLKRVLTPIKGDDILFKDDIVRVEKNQWEIKGHARPPSDPYNKPALDRRISTIASTLFAEGSIAVIDTDLLKTKKLKFKSGDYFVARGELFIGGVTFGLIGTKANGGYANVTNTGPFTLIIRIPKDGMYSLGIANYVDGYTSLENRLIINKIGWAKRANE